MWKIFIEYEDGSELTISGKHKDIPEELACKYQRYVQSHAGKAVYQ